MSGVEAIRGATSTERAPRGAHPRRHVPAPSVPSAPARLRQRLRIAQIAPPHKAIPPEGYGGSELVAGNLTEELVRRGHEVTLFAHPDSTTTARLVAFPEAAGITDFDRHELVHAARALEHAVEHAADFDIVHNHCLSVGPALAALAGSAGAPVVSTLHYQHTITPAFPEHPYVAISRSQRALAKALNVVAVVYNGIDCARFPLTEHERRSRYLLYMGRMDARKGTDIAIQVARLLDAELVLAGPPPDQDQVPFYEEHVQPWIGGRITYVGEAKGRRKIELLTRARCVLVPSRWNEPFGLVACEAMACGTPVVASTRGALPELVADGETGYLAATPQEMAAGVERAGAINPHRCRRHVEEHFSAASMAEGYLAVYDALLSGADVPTRTNAM